MATASIPHRWKYDVFVSFKGEDIHRGFIDHLFNDFKQKGIHAFRDGRELPNGEEIFPHLYNAIEESRFLIVIFSKRHATSSWCLKELVKILACKQNPKYEVRIIFYDVKHDVVRKQKGSYAEAFRDHEDSNSAEVSKWKEALSNDMTNGYESKFIDCISKDILVKLYKVNMIGICGISGKGKTTLAKAIYNLMYIHFEGAEDIGQGIMVIKKMMPSKPILLVLDDVDHRDQLEALAGSASWFFLGSLIIFTGKDKQLLRSHRVDEIHDMKFLDEDRSLQLFSLYAFEEKHPSTGFQELAEKVVKYVQGHPLARDGKSTRNRWGKPKPEPKTVSEWVSELERLRGHPNEEIHRVLRLSYDGLNLQQQNILLDIACLFIGEKSDFVASILNGCNFFAETNMRVVVDKSLITISSNMSLQMHDLIQAMAKEIIHEESIMTGKQRKLWNSSLVYNVLSEKKVARTEAVEVLVLPLENFSQKIHIDANDFAHMKKLQILKIYQEESVSQQNLELKGHNVIFSGNLYYLSNELSLFYWHGCPFKYLPSDFYPENIVAIDLSCSNIKHFWTKPKCLRRLKVMKLRYCCNLTTTPDFSDITNLEELSLEGCVNLVSVHPSIGMLKRLVVLNLRDCKRLRNLPSRLEMDAFQDLNLSGCLNVFRWWTSITTPFGLLSKQQHPQISVSLAGLPMLTSLNFSYCNLLQVPDSIGGLSCLKKLDLKGNNFTSLPGSLSQISYLQTLDVDGCKKLEVLPELPPSVWNVYASDCTSLREVSGSSKDPFRNRYNNFKNCPKLFKNVTVLSEGSISKSRCLDSSITSQGFIHQLSAFLGYMGVGTNNRSEFFLQDNIYSNLDIVYHGNSIPEWFTNKSTEHLVKVELASDLCYDKFRGYATCVVFKCKKPLNTVEGYSLKNFDGASLKPQDFFPHVIEEFLKKENNEDIEVKECGVRLIYDEDIQQEADLSMLQGLPTPTQHGGVLCLYGGVSGYLSWSW
ncbi:NB-ARC domains-containing protein [Tanacetum coccineum]